MTKVLIVEDDTSNLKLIVQIMELLGFITHTAENGFEALKMIDNDLYDMILMDIGLPGIDGIETARRIKEKPGYSKTPIIALTAFAMKGDREKILDAGLDYYLPKPIHVSEFIEFMKDIQIKRDK